MLEPVTALYALVTFGAPLALLAVLAGAYAAEHVYGIYRPPFRGVLVVALVSAVLGVALAPPVRDEVHFFRVVFAACQWGAIGAALFWGVLVLATEPSGASRVAGLGATALVALAVAGIAGGEVWVPAEQTRQGDWWRRAVESGGEGWAGLDTAPMSRRGRQIARAEVRRDGRLEKPSLGPAALTEFDAMGIDVSMHPRITAEIARGIWQRLQANPKMEFYYEIPRNLAGNPASPPDVLLDLDAELGRAYRGLLAKNPSSPPELLRGIAEHMQPNSPDYVRQLAFNPSSPPDVLAAVRDHAVFTLERERERPEVRPIVIREQREILDAASRDLS